MEKIIWVVYCTECGEIDRLANSDFAESIARDHKQRKGCANVLVGFYIKDKVYA